jgi:hypothetical protein
LSSGPNLPERSNNDCPNCILIYFVGSSLLPTPPVLPLFAAIAGSVLSIAVGGERILSLRIVFQARAPPFGSLFFNLSQVSQGSR